MIKKLNKFKKVFAVACAVAVVGSFVPAVNASAATNPTVSYSVSNANPNVNDTITVGIDVKNVSGLFGGAVDFAYDNSLFEVKSIAFGDLANNAKADVQKITSSQANIAFTLRGDATAITKSSGRLATITLKAKKAGSMTLKNSNDYSQLNKNGVNTIVKLADKSSNKIAYTNPSNVTIKVGSDVPVPPTPDVKVLTAGTYQENAEGLTYTGNWTNSTGANFSGGARKYSKNVGDSVSFTFEGTGFQWYGTKAVSRGIAKITIDGQTYTADSYASATTAQQLIFSKTGLTSGKHTVKIEVANNKNAKASAVTQEIDKIVILNGSVSEDTQVLKAGSYEENNAAIKYTGNWTTSNGAKFSGGARKYSNNVGASAEFTFEGTGFQWYGTKAVSRGIAKVTVDGQTYTADSYASATSAQQLIFSKTGLTSGKHTVKIEVVNKKNAKASAITQEIDKIVVVNNGTSQDTNVLKAGSYEENNAAIKYTGNWTTSNGAKFSGGARKYSNAVGASAEFTFEGTGFQWYGTKAVSRGIAKITIDGQTYTADSYASATSAQQLIFSKTGLTNGKHTVKIEVVNSKNAKASAITQEIDKIVIK